MNQHHDNQIVAHLRSALDEVVAKPVVQVRAAPVRRGLDTRRWVAIAASVVVVAGAGVGIAMYNGDNSEQASDPVVTASTAPGTSGGMPYFLAAADLAPGEVKTIVGRPADHRVTLAWVRGGDLADGLLTLKATPTEGQPEVLSTEDLTQRLDDGWVLEFRSNGLTTAEREDLAAQVIPGSGLPWILPVDGWTMVAMFTDADGPMLQQAFGETGVTLYSGPLVMTFLDNFTAAGTITNVMVAGRPGWQVTVDGTAIVMWRDPIGGQWVSLSVPPDMADRVDALLLAVVATNVPTTPVITGDPLPTLGNGADAAVALTAPTAAGAGLDGTVVTIDPAARQRPTLVVFVANWCPHCHAFLPNVEAWIADGTIPADVDVVVVATAESASAESSADWLAQLGWTTPVLVDGDNGDGQPGSVALAYGAPGWPYTVLFNADGTVAARTSGELTQSQMQQLLAFLA